MFNTEDVIFGSVYILPENTKYYNKNIYALLYIENENFSASYIVTFGDFNVRTCNIDDVIQVDEKVFDFEKLKVTVFVM